jgi:hypothetical protein
MMLPPQMWLSVNGTGQPPVGGDAVWFEIKSLLHLFYGENSSEFLAHIYTYPNDQPWCFTVKLDTVTP